jgi:molybdopterin molybdotransferase
LRAGRVLRPADLGLMASLGFGRCVCAACAWRCFPPATNCARLGQPLDPGCIYDSNRYSLIGALQRLGVEVHRPGPGARRPGGAAATCSARWPKPMWC